MSDAKENPLEETEDDVEAEMEENYNPDYQKVEEEYTSDYQKGEEEYYPNYEKSEEDYQNPEEECNPDYQPIKEEEYNANYQRLEGGREGEEYNPSNQGIGEEGYNLNYQNMEEEKDKEDAYNLNYQMIGGEEDEEEDNSRYQQVEEGGQEDEKEYNANDQKVEGEEENPNYQMAENIQQELEKEDTLAWRKFQEEEATIAEETEKQVEEEQEGDFVEQKDIMEVPQKITQAMMSFERLMFPGSQSKVSGTSLKKHSSSWSKPLLESEDSEVLELIQAGFPELGQNRSEEQQPCDELAEKTQDVTSEKGTQRTGEGVSFTSQGGQAGASEESLVSTTTEGALFKKDDSVKVFPLTMTWAFGWNSSLPVFNLQDEEHRVLLYVCAHTAIIYDVFNNSQHHLQGHANVISCLCISEDRRWIATADKGPNCLIIIWDSFTGIPVHTLFDSCPEGDGIGAIAITRDAKYLATISDGKVQKVCIWKWTLAVETPACTLNLNKEYGSQNYLTFNPTNNKELVSNSKTRAIYYSWSEEKNKLAHSAPLLTEKTFNKHVGKFSQSVFHLNATQILSATMEGKLVVWDIHRPPPSATTFLGFPYIKPCKLVHLQKEGITVLTTVDSYIVTGDIKGNIKFYDRTLAVVNWYSHFKLSSIRTLSFSKNLPPASAEKSNYPPDCTLKGQLFMVRNFIIGTSDATVYHLTADGTKLEKLFVEPKDAICTVACHPYQPLLAIGSVCGMIKVWNYENKTYLFSRVFEKGLGVQSLTYNPEGAILGAGFTEGTVYILDAMSLENETSEPFRYSRSSVTHISFSHDSQYMATADTNYTVALYCVVVKHGQRVWEYLARLHSHRKSIRSLLFGVHLDSNEPRLLSLGKDRLLIEYNLLKTYKDHLEVLDIHRTDQGCYPTCMVWYPPLTKELFLLICNSSYKVKLFNSTTKMCRKTLLGPTFGSPIEQIQLLPVKTTSELQKRYLVFINRDKVGLQILPVDGNPHKTSAIICHPNGVAGMTLSYDGNYVFTAGGHDRSVVQWEINLSSLEAAVSLGGEDLTPFYGLLSGGREGQFYRELEDYFYYSQLRSQGIDTMETREVSEHISLSEIPNVMRAIGFYPSEETNIYFFKTKEGKAPVDGKCRIWKQVERLAGQAAQVPVSWRRDRTLSSLGTILVSGVGLEKAYGTASQISWLVVHKALSENCCVRGSLQVRTDLTAPPNNNDVEVSNIDNMFNEIKFGEYVDTGKLVEKINLPDFLKVYINHRPPFGNTMSGIQHSFDVLGYTNSEGKKVIQRENFLNLLLTKGEHMTKEEMLDCFATLFGINPEGWKFEPATSFFKGIEISLEELPDEITAETFVTEILGLTISEVSRQDLRVSQ